MTQRYFHFLLCFTCLTYCTAQDALNIDLFGQFHRGDIRYSGSWAYIDGDGNEYALLGTRTGVAAYTIDDQFAIEEVGFIPGPESNWREITVIDGFAYVTSEGSSDGAGMQVIDLQYLPDSLYLLTTYLETFNTGHILQRDVYSDSAYVYVNGTGTTEGVHIMDVSNPANPIEIGLYDPEYRIHDCHVKNDLLFACAISEGIVDILDISDKSNPVKIAQIEDPTGHTHSCWVTEDDRYLVVCSEMDGLSSRIYNIEDFDNIYEVATYTANPLSLVHNPYIRGDFCFMTHNAEGLRILDIVDPELPVEVGYYDTYDGPSGGSSGLWSACPFYPSGKIIGGNREDGLYVWTFNNTKAGRIYGIVKDSITGEILSDVDLIILETQDTLIQAIDASFKWGSLSGSYSLYVEKEGYITKVQAIELDEADSLELVVELVSDTWVSVNDLELKNIGHLTIIPNPFSNVTKIDLSDFQTGRLLQLIDLNGRVLKTYNVEDQQELNIEREELPKGNYFLKLSDSKGEPLSTVTLVIH